MAPLSTTLDLGHVFADTNTYVHGCPRIMVPEVVRNSAFEKRLHLPTQDKGDIC